MILVNLSALDGCWFWLERACRNANFMPDFGYLTFLSILSEIKFGNFAPLSRVFRDLKRQNLATYPFVLHLV